VKLQILGQAFVDPPREAEELLITVAGLTLSEHCTTGHIQRGDMRSGALPDVVIDAPPLPKAMGSKDWVRSSA